MRLIDVDALPYSRVEWEDIVYAPTIDAVPVVRCKDCKQFEHIEKEVGVCIDKYGSVCGVHRNDWFCADGERRTE